MFLPSLRHRRAVTDPLAGVDPPPPAPAATERTHLFTVLTWSLGVAFVVIGSLLSLFVFNNFWLGLITQGLVFATIFLSFTVITGMAGQVSLCQASFAAIGAFTTAQLVNRFDTPVLVTKVT